jgi:hypothetical protein
MSYTEEDLKLAIKFVSQGRIWLFVVCCLYLGPPIKGITNDLKLSFYGYFKQAMSGPCQDPEPSRFQLVKRAQWQAWKKHGT